MTIEVDLKKCSYDFLIALLSHRTSLSEENKAAIIAELAMRNRSGSADVHAPH